MGAGQGPALGENILPGPRPCGLRPAGQGKAKKGKELLLIIKVRFEKTGIRVALGILICSQASLLMRCFFVNLIFDGIVEPGNRPSAGRTQQRRLATMAPGFEIKQLNHDTYKTQ